MERESFKIPSIIPTGLLLVAGAILCTAAFPSDVRKKMLVRDNYQCQAKGDLENCRGPLEAAHYNHDRRYGNYADLSNGRMLCVFHHLLDHILTRGHNGLTVDQNDWAIEQLRKRVPPK